MRYKKVRKRSDEELQEDIDCLKVAKELAKSEGEVNLVCKFLFAIRELVFEKNRRKKR